MKNNFLTSVVLILITFTGYSQTVNKKSLCKKWHLAKYEHNWIDYAPEEKEKNDYILLKNNMTYESVSEGKKTRGKWKLNENHNYFILYDIKGNGLKFTITELSASNMVFNLEIKDMEEIDIHYSTKKNGSY